MANENTTGEPLKATLADQLGEKAHLEDVHEQEKHASDPQERRVEKKKEQGAGAPPAEHAGFEAEAGRGGRNRRQPTPRRLAASRGGRAAPGGPGAGRSGRTAEPRTEAHGTARRRTGFQFPWAALAIAGGGLRRSRAAPSAGSSAACEGSSAREAPAPLA